MNTLRIKQWVIKIVTILAVLNPISLFFLVSIALFGYLALLTLTWAYAVLITLQDFIVTEYGSYMHPELRAYLLSWKLPQPQQESELKVRPATKLLLAAPLTVYISTRIATHSSLSMLDFTTKSLLGFIPVVQAFGNTIFRYIVHQIWAVRWFVSKILQHIVVPIFKAVTPIIELCIEIFLRIVIELWKLSVEWGPFIVEFVKQRFLWIWYKYVFFIRWTINFTKECYTNRLIPFIEQCKQIALNLWPHIKNTSLAVFKLCEELDRTYRPIIMPYLTYALLQTKYGFQLFWETSAFFLSSFWAVITGPWTLVWMVIDTTKELTLNALQFVKFQIAKVLHLGLALWYKMKPHITKVISDLTVFIRASLNQLKSFSHKVLDELHRLVIHYKVYETMNQIRVQLLNWARQLIKDTRIIGNQILASMQNLLSQILLTISYTVTTIQAQISYILLQLQFELQRFRKAF